MIKDSCYDYDSLDQLFTRLATQKWHSVFFVAEVYADALSDIFYYEHDDSSNIVVKILTKRAHVQVAIKSIKLHAVILLLKYENQKGGKTVKIMFLMPQTLFGTK
jgi:hypothetical protein